MSVVSQVMLKATFRILLARDKPERALQAAEEAFPVLHGHFVEGHKSAQSWVQIFTWLNTLLEMDWNGGNIAILSKIGQSQVKDDMPVLPCQHKGCFLSSGGLDLLENTRIWSYHFFVVFKSILELQWFWVVMQPHLKTHGILSCHFTLTKNSTGMCHAWNLFGCNCSISLPMLSPYLTSIYRYTSRVGDLSLARP